MHWIRTVAVSAAIPAILMAGAIIFGGPAAPTALDSVAAPFDNLDLSDMPPLRTHRARDGSLLSYREYETERGRDHVVIALHGSAGSSTSMHPLARALASAGNHVIAPDIRGHGGSGTRGDVSYTGQAEDDLADLIGHIRNTYPEARITLVGFSMGGGLALRFAAQRDDLERIVLIAPYLAHDAPPMVADNPNAPPVPWATAGVPRIVGLTILNRMGITALDGMTVVRLAVRDEDAPILAKSYTHRLLKSVNPVDWRRDLSKIADRLTVIAGARDGLHLAAAYDEVMSRHAPKADIVTVPDVDHIGLILEPRAHAALIATIGGN